MTGICILVQIKTVRLTDGKLDLDRALPVPQIFGTRSVPHSLPTIKKEHVLFIILEKRNGRGRSFSVRQQKIQKKFHHDLLPKFLLEIV